MQRLAIIGGGAIGLTAAYLAAKASRSVTLIEGADQLGGLLATFETEGDPLEFFYHHFFTHDREIRWLVDELGLDSHLFFRETRMGIFRDGRIFDFTTPGDLIRFAPLSFPGKLRFACTGLYLSRVKNWEAFEHISALEWFYRWAGTDATDAIWRPMLEIKFGRYARQVPLAWMIGRLGQRLRSRDSGQEKLGYLQGSLYRLVSALHRKLNEMGVEIVLGRKVCAIETRSGEATALRLDSGEKIQGDRFLCTVPPPLLSDMLDPEWQEYGLSLRQVDYFGAVCVVLMMRRPLSHIYWLNVADPGYPFGGVIEHTNFVPSSRYGGFHIAYLSRYVEQDNPLLTLSDQEIEQDWLRCLPRIYPDFRREDVCKVWVFRTRTAAPVCTADFSQIVPLVRSPVRNLYVANMAHIYPDERSVNNSIRIAANVCERMGIDSEVPAGTSLAGTIGFGA